MTSYPDTAPAARWKIEAILRGQHGDRSALLGMHQPEAGGLTNN